MQMINDHPANLDLIRVGSNDSDQAKQGKNRICNTRELNHDLSMECCLIYKLLHYKINIKEQNMGEDRKCIDCRQHICTMCCSRGTLQQDVLCILHNNNIR